jgi:hypothetical protein
MARGARTSGAPPSVLGLIKDTIDDTGRTVRLGALLVVAALCVCAIAFVLQLHADRWASVLAVAASVVAWLRLGRRPKPTPGRDGDEPAEDLTGDADGEHG